MVLGKTLIAQCRKRDWTLSRLAREAGVPKATLHGWTVGRKVLDLAQLRRVSMTLKVSLHELLFGVSDPHETSTAAILEELFSGDVRVSIQRIVRDNSAAATAVSPAATPSPSLSDE